MPHSNVARRYAQGVFQLAQEEQDLDGWRAELGRLEALLDDEVLRAAFANPAVSMARRLELAKRLAPELKPQSENLLRLLVEHQRTTEMQAIRRAFERMADEASGMVDVTLTSAVELAERLGRQVRIHYRRDPELIGGALIQIGDRVVDGSVRSQLQRLRQALAG